RVEQPGEDRVAIEARQAPPIDRAGIGHQRDAAPVPDHAIVSQWKVSRRRWADCIRLTRHAAPLSPRCAWTLSPPRESCSIVELMGPTGGAHVADRAPSTEGTCEALERFCAALVRATAQ